MCSISPMNKYTPYNLLAWLDLVWFDWVLWHNNNCRLFNAKSCLYIYIKYI